MNHRYLLLFERAFTVLGILFFSDSLTALGRTISELTGMSPDLMSTLISLARYLVWGITTILLCMRWQVAWSVAKRNKLVWVVAGLSIISTIWSENPIYTNVAVREVIQMTTFGLYLASRFKLRDQLYLIASTLGGVAIISTFFALVFPSVGISQDAFQGAWTGIFGHKNTLGKMMSLSLVTFAVLVAEDQFCPMRIYRLLTWGGLLLSFGLIILSTSKTSLSVSCISFIIMVSYRLIRKQGNKQRLYLEIFALAVLVAGLILTTSWEILITSMGRDITLTGRTEIWQSSLSQLMETNPLLGFGRGTFFAPDSLRASAAGASVSRGYVAAHAHNGYIDLALEIGFIGLTCFIGSFLIAAKHAITRSYVSKASKDLWPLIFQIWLVAYNLTESSLMRLSNIFWPTYVAVALCAKPTGHAVHWRLRKLRYPKSKKMTALQN